MTSHVRFPCMAWTNLHGVAPTFLCAPWVEFGFGMPWPHFLFLAMQLVAKGVVKLLPVRSFVSFRDLVAIQIWEPDPCEITAGSPKSIRTSTLSILPYLINHTQCSHTCSYRSHCASTNQRHCPLTSDHIFIQTFLNNFPRQRAPSVPAGRKPGLALAERSWCRGGAKCCVPPVVALLNPGALRWIGWRLWEATASNVSDVLPASGELRTLAEVQHVPSIPSGISYVPVWVRAGHQCVVSSFHKASKGIRAGFFVQNLETNSSPAPSVPYLVELCFSTQYYTYVSIHLITCVL